MVQSESAIGAVPTAGTWTDINTFTVPAGVKRLMRIKAGVASDPGALAQTHGVPVIRLTGSGLLEQSPHNYVLQGFTHSITAANTGSAPVEPDVFIYDVDIPVAVGGQIVVQQLMVSEVPAAMTIRVQLDYDENSQSSKNNMADYVNGAIATAAGAWTTVGTLTVPQSSGGNNPSRIREIRCGFVVDSAGNTLLRNSARFRLSGSGIAEGGLHHILGSQSGIMWTTPGAQKFDKPIVIHKNANIPVNPGGQILVEYIQDVELPDGGDSILGVLYE